MHRPSTLLEVHELLAFLPHNADENVVGAESTAELSPRHLVIRGVSGGVVGPPYAGITTQLLHGEESLLHLCAVQEPKLGLNHPKPVIGLERLSCLGEERQMGGRQVVVGGHSWSRSISCPIATTSGIGHELPQQLSLLIVGLKDRGDGFNQGRRQRRAPVWHSRLGTTPSVMSAHHSVIQTSYH
jgi:hypothetical protein